MSLKGKTVFITGSSRGIGQAIAFAFGQAGCNIVLNASQSKEALSSMEQKLKLANVPVLALLGDVSDYSACQKMFHIIEETFGSVDILINNAGISHIGLFTDMTPQEWQRVIDVNLNSVFNCTHLAVPAMVQKKQGSIINISSMWGEIGASCEAVYSASKGAMNSFTKAMAKELGPSFVRVNAIACGVIETQMNACFDEEERDALMNEVPLMRFGTPEEVANLALFLANETASYLTGQVITLDGGMN
ncbi:elongation factor P 5-aminopentanone reductase [Anaerotignum sp. MB30-C6]|uniref:elongation factor P 5-aminopentanone reductase n=1 Tax=Anaerotignum sp. MB30-C6 TaxID=3070814 RepID=UPI0027DC3A3F|nr:SDR family oxidoreductase [Anaerotignum sp. MB30-C6]WMI80415.1 SDR family oxidoreductase [Anaerotignum sp. MB30-C6]